MGCKKSKGPRIIPAIPEDTLNTYDRYKRFEFSLPFYRTPIDIFEGKVKRYVMGRTGVSLKQLRFSFGSDPIWEDIHRDDSLLCRILRSNEFKDDEDPSLISIHTLITWGLILCPGLPQMKTRVLYDVL